MIFNQFFTTGNNSHFIQAKKDQTSYFYHTHRTRSISNLTNGGRMTLTDTNNMKEPNSKNLL